MPPVDNLPLERFCNFIWWWATRKAERPTDVDKFRVRLWRPPQGVVPTKGPWTAEAETSAFQAFKKALKG